MAAAAAEGREPLAPLSSLNCKSFGRQSPGLSMLSQRPAIIRKSAQLRALRADSEAKAGSISENFVSGLVLGPSGEDRKPSMELSQQQNRSTQEHGESGSNYSSTGEDREDEAAVLAGDEQERKSLMELKVEAMTWAAMAKDYTIASLERRLSQALGIAKTEQDRNVKLGTLLRESKEREATAVLKLEDARDQIAQLIDAEERLCVQLGDLEAEAVADDRRYRSQIATLTARIEAQDQFIAEGLKFFNAGISLIQGSDSRSYMHTSRYQLLPKTLEIAKKEIAALQAELSDAMTELLLRKTRSSKLQALAKKRRYLLRKGAIRSIKLAPRPHKNSETQIPGGEGWKVFSILDFQA